MDPDVAFGVFGKVDYFVPVAAEIGGVVSLDSIGIETVEAVCGTYPEITSGVMQQGRDAVA